MHGIDERIGIREYEDAIRTYRQLVIEAAGS
jgi:acetylornithine deacetylase/succinyl-diaminopimelate desuccinylase-like protein